MEIFFSLAKLRCKNVLKKGSLWICANVSLFRISSSQNWGLNGVSVIRKSKGFIVFISKNKLL